MYAWIITIIEHNLYYIKCLCDSGSAYKKVDHELFYRLYGKKGVKVERFKISLAAARVNAKMTQEDVAKIMHVSKATIVNWERGKIIPKPAEVKMLSDLYKMPQDYIFFG